MHWLLLWVTCVSFQSPPEYVIPLPGPVEVCQRVASNVYQDTLLLEGLAALVTCSDKPPERHRPCQVGY